MAHLLRLRHGPCETWQLPRPPALTITNPPWGRRLMEGRTERGMQAANSERRHGRGSGHSGLDVDQDGDPAELVHTWKQLAKFCKVCFETGPCFDVNPLSSEHESRCTSNVPLNHLGDITTCKLLYRASATRRQSTS